MQLKMDKSQEFLVEKFGIMGIIAIILVMVIIYLAKEYQKNIKEQLIQKDKRIDDLEKRIETLEKDERERLVQITTEYKNMVISNHEIMEKMNKTIGDLRELFITIKITNEHAMLHK